MMKVAVALTLFVAGVDGADIATDACWTKVNTVVGYSQIACQDQSLTGWVPSNDLVNPSVKTDLTSIKVYKNKLSGWIPTELGLLTRLKVYTDYRNMISGYLPSEIGSLTAMTEINIYKNKVSGTIPEQAGGDPDNWPAAKIDWNNFVIMNNKFSGCIPMELTVCSDDLPNNSVNGYCSMSTQGAPGIDGNCGTLAPTSAAPTTSAPTTTPLCTWKDGYGLIGYGERKGNPDYSDGVKRREKLYGKRKVCREITTPSTCTAAKSKRVCEVVEMDDGYGTIVPACAWMTVNFKRGRKIKQAKRCVYKADIESCNDAFTYSLCMWARSQTGKCIWNGPNIFSGQCQDASGQGCGVAKSKSVCLNLPDGCMWRNRKCISLPVTCQGAKTKEICERVGIDNAVDD